MGMGRLIVPVATDSFATDLEVVDLESGDEPLSADYARRSLQSSARGARLEIRRAGSTLFTIDKAPGLFNPKDSPVACKFLAAIFDGLVPVRGKHVVDLGCGSGIIGLACILAGADRVTFTDLEPAAVAIERHPLFRAQDRFACLDLLSGESPDSADVILCIPPALTASQSEKGFAEAGIFRSPDFLERLVADAARVLAPGGRLVVWLRDGSHDRGGLGRFLEQAATSGFETDETVFLATDTEFSVDLREARNFMERVIIRLAHWSGHPDHVWYMLSLPVRTQASGDGPGRAVC
jgi:SAM-dependent methyltransferase